MQVGALSPLAQPWMLLVLTLGIGFSFALPELFLYSASSYTVGLVRDQETLPSSWKP